MNDAGDGDGGGEQITTNHNKSLKITTQTVRRIICYTSGHCSGNVKYIFKMCSYIYPKLHRIRKHTLNKTIYNTKHNNNTTIPFPKSKDFETNRKSISFKKNKFEMISVLCRFVWHCLYFVYFYFYIRRKSQTHPTQSKVPFAVDRSWARPCLCRLLLCLQAYRKTYLLVFSAPTELSRRAYN